MIVDNGSPESHASMLRRLTGASVHLIPLGRNFGIGVAHNRGIAWARKHDATHVLLLDQDSFPEPRMVAELVDAEQRLLERGHPVGAVGPVYHDPRIGKSWPFFRLSRFGVSYEACEKFQWDKRRPFVVPCDFLISSGMLVRTAVLDRVGLMREEYFLEHVDTEWSLRARHCGFQLYGVCRAQMQHSLGDSAIRLPLSSRRVQVYAPYRYYYLFRNAVLLAREEYAVLPWKLHEIRRLLIRMVLFSVVVPPRAKRFRMMLLGLWHGVLGKTGALEP